MANHSSRKPRARNKTLAKAHSAQFAREWNKTRRKKKLKTQPQDPPKTYIQGESINLPRIAVPIGILYETSQHLTPSLQEWVPRHNLQEPLKTLTPVLNDVVTEPVREHLTRQRGNSNSRALALEDIAEILKVGVAATHDRVLQLEGRDVGSADDFVRGVHVPGCAMGLGVADLDLKEVLRWPVDLLKGLLA